MKDDEDDVQPSLPLVDTHIHRLRGFQLIEACAAIAKSHGWTRSAKELDKTFIDDGRPVSEGTLRNSLKVEGNERNYARLEWLPYFTALSDEPAQVIAGVTGKVLVRLDQLSPKDELALLKDHVVSEFGAAGARLVMNLRNGGRRR